MGDYLTYKRNRAMDTCHFSMQHCSTKVDPYFSVCPLKSWKRGAWVVSVNECLAVWTVLYCRHAWPVQDETGRFPDENYAREASKWTNCKKWSLAKTLPGWQNHGRYVFWIIAEGKTQQRHARLFTEPRLRDRPSSPVKHFESPKVQQWCALTRLASTMGLDHTEQSRP